MKRSLIFLGAVLAACSSTPATPDASTGDAGVREDAAAPPPDAGPPPADSGVAEACPRSDAGRCRAIVWTSTASRYPVVVDHHTTLVTEGGGQAFLTVIGGIRSDSLGGAATVYAAVRRAPIAADGTLGAFEEMPALPLPIAFHAQAVHRGVVYLMAGVTSGAGGPSANATIVWGRIEADGRIATWRTGELPREVRIHPSAGVIGDRLFVVGGTGAQGVVLPTVITARLAADGTPGPFVSTLSLPEERSHHTSAVAGGSMYVLGGFGNRMAARPAILRSVHDESGELVDWEQLGELPETPWTSSAVVHRGWLMLVGGGEGDGALAHFVHRVRAAPIQPDGTLGAFEDVDAPLPIERSHVHQTPVFRGMIYSIGGRVDDGAGGLASTDRIFVGRLW